MAFCQCPAYLTILEHCGQTLGNFSPVNKTLFFFNNHNSTIVMLLNKEGGCGNNIEVIAILMLRPASDNIFGYRHARTGHGPVRVNSRPSTPRIFLFEKARSPRLLPYLIAMMTDNGRMLTGNSAPGPVYICSRWYNPHQEY